MPFESKTIPLNHARTTGLIGLCRFRSRSAGFDDNR